MAARLGLAGLLLLGGVSAGSVALAQSSGSALSPAAKGAYLRGVAAANQGDWELAIKYFGEAREEAPTWPDALHNLAISSHKAGGRELIAIAWYQAYLAAAPNADDADQVRAWIAELDIKVEARLRRLIQRVKKNAGQIKDWGDRYEVYQEIVYAQAKAGDIAGAKETATLFSDEDEEAKSIAYREIVNGQNDVGDFAGAKETASRISYKDKKFFAYRSIADAQARVGDIAGAKETAARILDEEAKSYAYRDIVDVQAMAGDIAGAKETAARIPYEEAKARAYGEIAFAQAKKSDYAEIDRAQAQVEEIASWTRLATIRIWRWSGSVVVLEDWQGFLESLKDEEPDKVVESLSEAAFKMGYALNTIRKKETEWQKKRAEAAK
jgi:tetratricopeptide (TPR) repeat protein